MASGNHDATSVSSMFKMNFFEHAKSEIGWVNRLEHGYEGGGAHVASLVFEYHFSNNQSFDIRSLALKFIGFLHSATGA